jgi:putative ABC transport system permease protein
MNSFFQDVRYSARMLAKTPGFTLSALLALILGIGANSTMFSVVNAALLHPLRYPNPERLVVLLAESVKKDIHQWPVLDFDVDVWRRENHVFEQISAFGQQDFNLTLGHDPERLGGMMVSANFFDMLRVRPAIGRSFQYGEDQQGHEHVAIISNALWQRRFNSDPGAIGRPLILNGQSYTLIGIMPPDFMRMEDEDLWVPRVLNLADPAKAREHRGVIVFGRLKDGKTIREAQTEMNAIAGRISSAYPATHKDLGVRVNLWQSMQVSDVRTMLIALWAAVGFVLLIACANVANLLLVKANMRRREIAVRLALGAGRFRLIRQLLTESSLLALLGGIIGLGPTLWGVDLVRRSIHESFLESKSITVDGSVLGYTLLVSLVTGICFGLLPALTSAKTGISEMLKQGSARDQAGSGHRLRSIFVVAEISIALMLLIGAGLMLKSFAKLHAVDPGFNPSNVLTMRLSLPSYRYDALDKQTAFLRDLLDRLQTLPGVQSAGLTSELPANGEMDDTSVYFPGTKETIGFLNAIHIHYSTVSPNYFSAMQIHLLAGRDFNDADSVKAQPVAVINDKMAREYWPGMNPLGKSFKANEKWWTVAGVVANVHSAGLQLKPTPEIYFPYQQFPLTSVQLAVRTMERQEKLADSIRQTVLSLDPDQPIYDIQTMQTRLAISLNAQQVTSGLCGVFAVVALMLAIVGIYSVMSFVVNQRTHEIGIRMALGAQQKDVVRMVVGRGAWMIALGLGIGTLAAAGINRLMTDLLFGVSPTDPSTFASVAASLAAVALVASYVPARRAARVDPVIALREE